MSQIRTPVTLLVLVLALALTGRTQAQAPAAPAVTVADIKAVVDRMAIQQTQMLESQKRIERTLKGVQEDVADLKIRVKRIEERPTPAPVVIVNTVQSAPARYIVPTYQEQPYCSCVGQGLPFNTCHRWDGWSYAWVTRRRCYPGWGF